MQNTVTQKSTKKPRSKGFIDSKGWCYATGRRKSAVCKIWVKHGSGQFKVNGMQPTDYFKRESLVFNSCHAPISITQLSGLVDFNAQTYGGGLSAQSGALRLGLSRAIQCIDDSKRPILKKSGFLTRDSRKVERKKYGRKKARKSTQYSKR